MNEANAIAEALALLPGVASVTRGWPKQSAVLPCIAVGLEEQSTADTRDNAVYLTRRVYSLRVFTQTMGACDALADSVIAEMETLGYTLERALEIGGEIAQLKMTFHKLD
jgi:hypothetical protein